MVKVHHKPKGRSYDYPDESTARRHCAQAVEQSQGKLTFRMEKDGDFTILPAAKGKE